MTGDSVATAALTVVLDARLVDNLESWARQAQLPVATVVAEALKEHLHVERERAMIRSSFAWLDRRDAERRLKSEEDRPIVEETS